MTEEGNPKPSSKSWIEKVKSSPVLMALRSLPRAGRGFATALPILIIASAVLPTALIAATGKLIGTLPPAAAKGIHSISGQRALEALTIVATLYIASQSLGPLRDLVVQGLGRRFDHMLTNDVLESLMTPAGIGHLEDRAIADLAGSALDVGRMAPLQLFPSTVADVAAARLQGLGSALLLGGFRWWAPLLLFPSWVATRVWVRREVAGLLKSAETSTTALRRANYFSDLAMEPASSKEIRIFDMAPWVIGRFRQHWLDGMRDLWRQRAGHKFAMAQAFTMLLGTHAFIFYLIGKAAMSGEIGVGAVALYTGSVLGMAGLGYTGDADWRLAQIASALPKIKNLGRLVEKSCFEPSGHLDAETVPKQAIKFEHLVFAYPGRANVFDGLNLTIPAGRSIAIVGVNGAGKTTLIKLLTRLYEPDKGRITVDGVDLGQIDPTAWRRKVAVILQDFVRYELPVIDNVGFGALSHSKDREALNRAAQRAGAMDLIKGLPNGWDTVLTRQFEGGVDLSGGQWQRIALARALFAVEGGASVLVLDEPTASLDVRAEAELFERFLEITQGLTTILISHRFSTVRRADHICVLSRGTLEEEGSHDALMDKGGLYAEMFRMQASRFEERNEEGA